MNLVNHDSPAVTALYTWGGRAVGIALLVGVAIAASRTGAAPMNAESEFARLWANAVLIGLWLVPVFSLFATGVAWIRNNRQDWTGWMAIGISLFLSSLWVLT